MTVTSAPGGGALTFVHVDRLGEEDTLRLSGWASLVWVSVSKDNMEKALKLMDSTIIKKVPLSLHSSISMFHFYLIYTSNKTES